MDKVQKDVPIQWMIKQEQITHPSAESDAGPISIKYISTYY